MTRTALFFTAVGIFCGHAVASDDWPQFRRPNAAGISTNANLPDKWSANENGVCCVLRASDTFELLYTNKLADDDMCLATPALAGDRLLIRTAGRLYGLRAVASAGHPMPS